MTNGSSTAASLIVRKGDSILMVDKNYPPFGLDLVGGCLEYGESPRHAAKREAEEESNTVVSVGREICHIDWVYGNEKRDEYVYEGNIVSGTPTGSIEGSVNFVPLYDVYNKNVVMSFPEKMKKIMKEYMEIGEK